MFRHVCHQVEEVVHLFAAVRFEQCEYHLAPVGGHEVAGILDTVADALVDLQLAGGLAAQEYCERVTPNRGKDRHVQAL